MRWLSCWLLVLACGCGQSASSPSDEGGRKNPEQADSGPARCTGDHACSDGVFCNGIERCEPSARDADEHGCVPASEERCLETQRCDENEAACLSDCDEHADADNDGHDAENCGGLDCDDADAERFPGNAEVCDADGHDEDCDRETLAGDDGDADNDGHIAKSCCNGDACGGDCDDETHYTYPGTGELCDEADNDCDGDVDETPAEVPWYADRDGDHYGVQGDDEVISCAPVAGHALSSTDCDDGRATVNPGNAEACDSADNDCDGETDEGLVCGGCDPACDAHARCVERDGDPTCICDDGFEGDGHSCEDIDECAAGIDECDSEPGACLNTSGGFECECPEGYVGNGRGENGCTDFNECVNGTDDCDNTPDACVNEAGGFVCMCPSGYAGDGVGGSGCADIDECTEETDGCDGEPQACVNAVGSFECECPEGYEGDGVGDTGCTDVDECALASNGGCDSEPDACMNALGSHACECPDGYSGDGEGASGCEDIDECAINNGGCDTEPDACMNTEGAHACECPFGYAGDGIGASGCADIDECEIDNGGCDLLASCTEGAPGTRICGACPSEYGGDGESGCLLALTGLSLSSGTLAPSLDPDVTSYTGYLPFFETIVTLTPSVLDGLAIEVDGTDVESGAGVAIALESMETIVELTVRAADRASRFYTITLRQGLPPTEDYGDPGPFSPILVSTTGPDGNHTLYRPLELGGYGLLHPPAVWGNAVAISQLGYQQLLLHIASHGVVIIASDTAGSNVETMTAALEWLIAQNADDGELMGKLDVTQAAALGHSIGANAAIQTGAHSAVAVVVSMHGTEGPAENLHGPLLLLAGDADTIVSRALHVMPTFNRSLVPTFLGELGGGTQLTPLGNAGDERAAVTAWLRLWLYGDEGARHYFEGDEPVLCNSPWLTTCASKNWPTP